MTLHDDLSAALAEYDADPSLGKAVRIIEAARTHAPALAEMARKAERYQTALENIKRHIETAGRLLRTD